MAAIEVKVEVRFDGTTWVDVSSRVLLSAGLTISRGRETEADDPISVGTCSMTLVNDDGAFSPRLSSSPYYPYVTDGVAVRVFAWANGAWRPRFFGFAQSWVSTATDGGGATAECVLTVADVMSAMPEYTLWAAPDQVVRWAEPVNYWPLRDSDGPAKPMIGTVDLVASKAETWSAGARLPLDEGESGTDAPSYPRFTSASKGLKLTGTVSYGTPWSVALTVVTRPTKNCTIMTLAGPGVSVTWNTSTGFSLAGGTRLMPESFPAVIVAGCYNDSGYKYDLRVHPNGADGASWVGTGTSAALTKVTINPTLSGGSKWSAGHLAIGRTKEFQTTAMWRYLTQGRATAPLAALPFVCAMGASTLSRPLGFSISGAPPAMNLPALDGRTFADAVSALATGMGGRLVPSVSDATIVWAPYTDTTAAVQMPAGEISPGATWQTDSTGWRSDVTVTWPDGTSYTATRPDGARKSLALEGVHSTRDRDRQFADWLVSTATVGAARMPLAAYELSTMTEAQKQLLCALAPASRVSVTSLPVSMPATVGCVVEGLDESISAESWTVEYRLSPDLYAPIVLDPGSYPTVTVPLPDMPTGTDTRTPATPADLAVSSTLYVAPTGGPQSRLVAGWSPVVQATDTTAISIAAYEVWGQKQGEDPAADWVRVASTPTETAAVAGFTPGEIWSLKVGAVAAYSGVPSALSDAVTLQFGDDEPPTQPSTPTVSVYLGSLVVGWDGKDSTGGDMPSDFKRCEVHLSTVSGFAPTAATLKAQMLGAGTVSLPGLTYGTTYYARLVCVDLSGNTSTPSAQASGVPQRAVSNDLAQTAIDSIRDYSVDAVRTTLGGRVTTSTSNPPGTYTGASGDKWEKYTAGALVAVWKWNGAGWDALTIDPTYIPQIDIGLGTFGSLSGDRLAAQSVLASKLAVTDWRNYAVDGDFRLGKSCWSGSGTVITQTTKPNEYSVPSVAGTNADQANVFGFTVTPGEEFWISFDGYAESGISTYNSLLVIISVTNAAGAQFAWPGVEISAATLAASPTTWLSAAGKVVMPAGAVSARVALMVLNNGIAGNTYLFRTVKVYRRNAGELIVDGAITANHITAGAITTGKLDALAVTADKIAAGAITANKLDADAINGKTITGATVQTGFSGSRVILDSGGLVARDGTGKDLVSINQGNFGAIFMRTPDSAATQVSMIAWPDLIHMYGMNNNKIANLDLDGLSVQNPPTTTTTADACWTSPASDGFYFLKRKSSLRKLKIAYEDLDVTPEAVLDLRPRQWFDKDEVAAHGLDPDTATAEECLAAGLRWIPGFIAEEVEETAPAFSTYEQDQTRALGGVAYDRLAAGLLVVAQAQAAQIAALEARLAALEAK